MDYSLLLAIHNLDKEPKTNSNSQLEAYYEARISDQMLSNEQPQQSATLNAAASGGTMFLNSNSNTKAQTLGPNNNAYSSSRHAENLFKV